MTRGARAPRLNYQCQTALPSRARIGAAEATGTAHETVYHSITEIFGIVNRIWQKKKKKHPYFVMHYNEESATYAGLMGCDGGRMMAKMGLEEERGV